MKKINTKIFDPIDKEEKELMESIEQDEWKPVKNMKQEKEKAITAARNTLRKDKRINLRLSEKDYHQIQIKAIEEGIPYQTFISSIIHKYLNGSFFIHFNDSENQNSDTSSSFNPTLSNLFSASL